MPSLLSQCFGSSKRKEVATRDLETSRPGSSEGQSVTESPLMSPRGGASASPMPGLTHTSVANNAPEARPTALPSVIISPPAPGPQSGSGATSSAQVRSPRASSTQGSGSRAGLHAPRIPTMDAASVVECDPFQLTQGISLTTKELGRGSYGVVLAGSFRGLPVAVKVMVAPSLDRPALRELLLGPSVSHPNIVQTYTSRCATMSDEYFDFLEGGPRDRADQGLPRLLLDIPLHSGDGFGAPGVLEGDFKSSFLILHKVLVDLKAMTGQVAILIVQEHADKGTLRSAIQGGMFAPREGWSLRVARRALLRTASEMARGMLHLHDVGLVHADLKPANVLLSNSPLDRRGCTAKVTDFGLSHVIPPNENSIRTDSWGSVAYMSPEAFAGSLSRAADVWAFGVILHEMLTGQRPFEGLKAPDAIQIIRNSPTPLTWPPNLPMSSGIVHLGRACLHRDPAQRPTMERVLHVLVGMEQCIRANLLLGPEAVTEILDSHGRDEDVTAIIERAIALARAVEAPPGAGGPAAPGNAAAAAAAAAAGAPVGPLTPSGSAAPGLAGPGVRRTGSYSPQEQELA